MNKKNICEHLDSKLKDWLGSITNANLRKELQDANLMVTGGAIVSLLTNEKVNDYDIYFPTKDICLKVLKYYSAMWNTAHPDKHITVHRPKEDGRIRISATGVNMLGGSNVAVDTNFKGQDDTDEVYYDGETSDESVDSIVFSDIDVSTLDDDGNIAYLSENDKQIKKPDPEIDVPKYRPIFISANAITLSNGIQLVIRFYGNADTIHENFDFTHCKCVYETNPIHEDDTFKRIINRANNPFGKLTLPPDALACIINKELIYNGSKYPLCSIIRTRKFLSRGWTINAGQYVKMAFQLNELDLKDINVFKEQLIGVDSMFFSQLIDLLQNDKINSEKMDALYVMNLIDEVF